MMVHPEWALKYKKKGTELRNIRGRFYLYRISSKCNKEGKVIQKITHEMLGRITEEDGFIPRGIKKKKLVASPSSLKQVCTRESEASTYLSRISQNIIESLRIHFPQSYLEIFTLAISRLIHQSPLKNMEFLYENSMLSEDFKGLGLSKNRLTSLLRGCFIQSNG